MLYIIIGLLILQNVLWYFILKSKINEVLVEVKKGNKDQQEIKTKLTWLKKRQYDLQTAVKRTLLKAFEEAKIKSTRKK